MFGYTRPASTVQALLVAACVSLSSFSNSTYASLSSYNNAGADLVYSSVSDVTWTKDANLLGTMMAADSNLISKIIAANSGFTYTNPFGTHPFSASNFNPVFNNAADYYGAIAFTRYLNSINYGGSNQWMLPSANGSDVQNGSAAGEEFAELYYGELGGSSAFGPGGFNSGFIDSANQFDNEQNGVSFNSYWTASQSVFYGGFGFTGPYSSSSPSGVWVISAGRVTSISAVPEPESVGLLLLGLGIVGARVRRQK